MCIPIIDIKFSSIYFDTTLVFTLHNCETSFNNNFKNSDSKKNYSNFFLFVCPYFTNCSKRLLFLLLVFIILQTYKVCHEIVFKKNLNM